MADFFLSVLSSTVVPDNLDLKSSSWVSRSPWLLVTVFCKISRREGHVFKLHSKLNLQCILVKQKYMQVIVHKWRHIFWICFTPFPFAKRPVLYYHCWCITKLFTFNMTSFMEGPLTILNQLKSIHNALISQ